MTERAGLTLNTIVGRHQTPQIKASTKRRSPGSSWTGQLAARVSTGTVLEMLLQGGPCSRSHHRLPARTDGPRAPPGLAARPRVLRGSPVLRASGRGSWWLRAAQRNSGVRCALQFEVVRSKRTRSTVPESRVSFSVRGAVRRDVASGLTSCLLLVFAIAAGLMFGVTDADAGHPSLRADRVGRLVVRVGEDASDFVPVAVSGNAVVAGAQALVGSSQQRVLYLFTKPGGGWASQSPAARLTASDSASGDMLGFYAGSVGISGGTVVASSPNPADPGRDVVDVFTEPAGGWSGTVHEAAQLTASAAAGCTGPDAAAVSGPTVVVSCSQVGSGSRQGALLVFTEPAGGWSGTLHEAAKLVPSSGGRLYAGASVAISGQTIVADGYNASGTHGAAFVFREPRSGWSGTVRQAAMLTASNGAFFNPMAVVGRNVFAATNAYFVDKTGRASAYVFSEPAGGWSGTVHQAATLTYVPDPNVVATSMAASDRTVAVGFAVLGAEHSCPCTGSVVTFAKPTSGWSGTLAADGQVRIPTSTGFIGLAAQGQTIFASDGDGVDIFNQATPPSLPTASQARLTGLRVGQPKLSFRIRAGPDAPLIKSMVVTLPDGLGFAKQRDQLVDGLFVAGAGKYSLSASHQKLSMTLKSPVLTLSIAIGRQAFRETNALLKTVRRLIAFNNARKHQTNRAITLRLGPSLIRVGWVCAP